MSDYTTEPIYLHAERGGQRADWLHAKTVVERVNALLVTLAALAVGQDDVAAAAALTEAFSHLYDAFARWNDPATCNWFRATHSTLTEHGRRLLPARATSFTHLNWSQIGRLF